MARREVEYIFFGWTMEHDEMNTWLGKQGGRGFLADSFERILPKGVHCASVMTKMGRVFFFYVEQAPPPPDLPLRLEGGLSPKKDLDVAAPGLGTTDAPLVIRIEDWLEAVGLEKTMEPRMVSGRHLMAYV